MITGYNTDIRHNEVVFHVQTEDKGLANPFIESLVYVGGQVLASKRFSYAELLAQGKEEKDIVTLMDHQHRTMIAAIRHGKLDAKFQAMMAGKATTGAVTMPPAPTPPPAAAPPPSPPPPPFAAPRAAPMSPTSPGFPAYIPPLPPDTDTGTIARPASSQLPPLPSSPPARERTLDQVILEYLTNEADQEQLVPILEDESDLGLGRPSRLVLRTRSSKSGMPVAGTQVSVRMISTVAEPQILASGRTDDEGLAVLVFDIPAIGRGTAALIITAVGSIGRAELKHLL